MAPINAVVLVKTGASKATSYFTNYLKRYLKRSPGFKPYEYESYETLPTRLKITYKADYYYWRYWRFYHITGWKIQPFKKLGYDWTLVIFQEELSAAMARSLKIEQFSTKKAEKLLKDIPRQTEIFERTLDFITNVINGAITLIIIYIVYYEWEEQGKEEEKLKKQEMIDQFKQIQDASAANEKRIVKMELDQASIREELEELRPKLVRLLILLNATPNPLSLPNEPKNKFNVIECDAANNHSFEPFDHDDEPDAEPEIINLQLNDS